MRHPETFFGKSHESARIAPNNPYVLKPQLLCAAYEAPLTARDTSLFDDNLPALAQELVDDGFLHIEGGRWHLESQVSPNPPKDTDGRREESGRGVRELQGK